MLRSPGAETVATLFQRVAEMYALPASVPRNTLLHPIVEPHPKLDVDHALSMTDHHHPSIPSVPQMWEEATVE